MGTYWICIYKNFWKLPQDEFEENKKEKENEFKKGLIEQIEKCNKRVNKELRKNIITPNDVK